MTFELSASVAPEYPGQILRTVTLGRADATSTAACTTPPCQRAVRYASVSVAAASALALVEASACIEEAGYTTTDDLFHGLGMGYLEPIGTSCTRVPIAPAPTSTCSRAWRSSCSPTSPVPDHRAGVQTGEMVIVTDEGFEDIHRIPTGLVTR